MTEMQSADPPKQNCSGGLQVYVVCMFAYT